MRSLPRRYLVLVFLLALGPAGCGSKVNEERTWSLEPGDKQYLLIDGPRYDQKVTATTSTEGTPIDVYLVIGTQDGADEAIKKKTDKVLDSKIKTADPALAGTVPAGKEYAVVAINNGNKKATVKVKVVGK